MTISDLPIFSMLRTRMQWHQERQKVLAENVANANTPSFKPRDLVPPEFNPSLPRGPLVTVALTDPAHIGGRGVSAFGTDRRGPFEIRPAGNAVSLEDEMMKVAANQTDFQMAATLYSRSLNLIKTALGRG